MVRANRPSIISKVRRETQDRNLFLRGLSYKKKVCKGSGCGTIHVPKELIGKQVIMTLMPINEESLHDCFKEINVNEAERKARRLLKAAETRKATLAKKIAEAEKTNTEIVSEKTEELATTICDKVNLEDDDAY